MKILIAIGEFILYNPLYKYNPFGYYAFLLPGVFIAVYVIFVALSATDKRFRSLPFVLAFSRITLTIIGTLTAFATISGWLIGLDIFLVPYLAIVYFLYKYLLRRHQAQLSTTATVQSSRDWSRWLLIGFVAIVAAFLLYLRQGNIV